MLIQYLDNSSCDDLVVYVLVYIGVDTVPHLIDSLSTSNIAIQNGIVNVISELAPKSKEAIPALIHLMDNDNNDLRLKTLHVLIAFNEDANEAIPFFVDALKIKNEKIPDSWSVRFLTHMGEPALPWAIELLKSDRESTFISACLILFTLKDISKEAIPHLKQYTHDKNPMKRITAIKTLLDINPKSIHRISEIVSLFNHDKEKVRLWAALMVSEFGEKSVPELLKAMQNDDSVTKSTAIISLIFYANRIKFNNPINSSSEVYQVLFSAMDDPNEKVRQYAAKSMASFDLSALDAVPKLNELTLLR